MRRSKYLPPHWYREKFIQQREARGLGNTNSDGTGPRFAGVCLQCGYVHGVLEGCIVNSKWRSRKGPPLPKEPECTECGFFHSWDSNCPRLRRLTSGTWVALDKTDEAYRKEIAFVRKWVTNRA